MKFSPKDIFINILQEAFALIAFRKKLQAQIVIT